MILDLRKGFGKHDDYELFKFPDGSIKFKLLKPYQTKVLIKTTLRSNDDIIALIFAVETIKHRCPEIVVDITYLMYQQDDRCFSEYESFGLKIITTLLNTLPVAMWSVFHPHSDKVEFLNNCVIRSNIYFITNVLAKLGDPIWIIPDAGAFKTQFKQIEQLQHKDFVICTKSRDHATGELVQTVNTEDLKGKDCIIFDDICLGGRTFLGIASELRKKNCGKLYLAVSHGLFNNGIDHLLTEFEHIYTTDSICTLKHEKLTTFNI